MSASGRVKTKYVGGKITAEWFGFIDAANSFAADFSDGAFMAHMEECGIQVEDLEAYSEECARRQAARPAKK